MNFGIKSTFNERTGKSVGLLRHSAWVFIVNASTSSILGWLYLTNRSIPAVIVSRPGGNLFLAVVIGAVIVKVLGSLYAAVIFLIRNHLSARRAITWLYLKTNHIANKIVKQIPTPRRQYTSSLTGQMPCNSSQKH